MKHAATYASPRREGQAETAGEAMALAWIHAHAPDALIDAHVELGAVPYNVPDGWRFELTRAWLSPQQICNRDGRF